MIFINKGRAEGKSFNAVQIAALSTGGVTVIASDISHKRYLQNLATEHFDKKINVLTYDELHNGKLLGQKERDIIIDNTEQILMQIFRGYNIVAVTGAFGNQDVFSSPPHVKYNEDNDKFKLVAAAACNPGQIVIARTDGEGMHGSDYMVINADKKHAPFIYMLYRFLSCTSIKRFEEKWENFLEQFTIQIFKRSDRVERLLEDYRKKRGVWFDTPPQTEQNDFTTDDMQKVVTKIKLDKEQSGITDQQIIDKQVKYDEYNQNVVLRQQLELANKTIEALTTLILNPKQQ